MKPEVGGIEEEMTDGREGDDLDGSDDLGGRVASVRLKMRDLDLFVHLAHARYLSTEQIRSLVFGTIDESSCRKRLSRLAAGPKPYIARIPYRQKGKGQISVCWRLAPLGQYFASRHSPGVPQLPKSTPAEAFLEHEILLNDLYTRLALGQPVRAGSPYRWIPGDRARLSYQTMDGPSHQFRERRCAPDAMVEIPGAPLRVWIEAETGAHPLGLVADSTHSGSTKAKIQRYTQYVAAPSGGSERTGYASAFPDGWPSALIFIALSPRRRDAIRAFAQKWRRSNPAVPMEILAFDPAEAHQYLAALALGRRSVTPSPPMPECHEEGFLLTRSEASAVYDFYKSTINQIEAAKAGRRCDDPLRHDEVHKLCLRFRPLLKASPP